MKDKIIIFRKLPYSTYLLWHYLVINLKVSLEIVSWMIQNCVIRFENITLKLVSKEKCNVLPGIRIRLDKSRQSWRMNHICCYNHNLCYFYFLWNFLFIYLTLHTHWKWPTVLFVFICVWDVNCAHLSTLLLFQFSLKTFQFKYFD